MKRETSLEFCTREMLAAIHRGDPAASYFWARRAGRWTRPLLVGAFAPPVAK